jgi:hypothetical protein
MANKIVYATLGAALLGMATSALRSDDARAVTLRSGVQSMQDPKPSQPASDKDKPASPPEGAVALRPIEDPYVEPVQRGDLPERYGVRDPLEGLYEVKERFLGGQPAPAGQGYMVVGRRHIVVHFMAPGPDPRVPLVRAQVFTWTRADNSGMVRMTNVVGHFDDEDGDMLVERPGTVQMRRFEPRQGVLRVYQDGGGWIDFVRVE